MTAEEREGRMAGRDTVYRVAMVLIGVAGLVTKRRWMGAYGDLIWSYWGNVTASFSVFFVVGLVPRFRRSGRLTIAAVALLVVELFELTDGFGVMTNVYDSVDLVANVAGIGLAFLADTVLARARARRTGGSSAFMRGDQHDEGN